MIQHLFCAKSEGICGYGLLLLFSALVVVSLLAGLEFVWLTACAVKRWMHSRDCVGFE